MAIDNFFLNDMCVKKVEFMEITEEEGAVFEDVKYIFFKLFYSKRIIFWFWMLFQGNFDGLIGLAFPKLGKGTKTVVDNMKE